MNTHLIGKTRWLIFENSMILLRNIGIIVCPSAMTITSSNESRRALSTSEYERPLHGFGLGESSGEEKGILYAL